MTISLIFPGMQYHLDLLGTGAFALASSSMFLMGLNNDACPMAFDDFPLRLHVSSAAVVVWLVKLASFLFFQVCKVKTDARLDAICCQLLQEQVSNMMNGCSMMADRCFLCSFLSLVYECRVLCFILHFARVGCKLSYL